MAVRSSRPGLLSPLLSLFLALPAVRADGPAPLPRAPIRSDLHLRYQPLESGEARALLERARAFARLRLGEPAVSPKRVHLRRSVPLPGGEALPSGFQLTEITDSTEGVFTIYLSARPGEQAFAGQLAHEAFHLQNARLRDVYVEGLNGLLAEDFLRETGLPWEPWLLHFQNGKDPLYGAAYFLFRELAGEIGREPLHRLLRFAVESPGKPALMEIDIDRWLDSLEPAPRERARAVITRRFEPLAALRSRDQPELAFRRPRAR